MFRCRIPPPRRLRDRGRGRDGGGGDVHVHHVHHAHDGDDARARLHRDDGARAHPLLLRFRRFFRPQSPESSRQRLLRSANQTYGY